MFLFIELKVLAKFIRQTPDKINRRRSIIHESLNFIAHFPTHDRYKPPGCIINIGYSPESKRYVSISTLYKKKLSKNDYFVYFTKLYYFLPLVNLKLKPPKFHYHSEIIMQWRRNDSAGKEYRNKFCFAWLYKEINLLLWTA